MTEDLEAIDVLSQSYFDAVKKMKRYDSGDAIILTENDPLIARGLKVQRMYEAEMNKAPGDENVKSSLSLHFYRIGWMYYDAIFMRYLGTTSQDASSLATSAGTFAHYACYYMMSSFHLIPNSAAALVLADIFRSCGFYGSALYWLFQAEQLSAPKDRQKSIEIKAQRLDLQFDGKVADPPLSQYSRFPTPQTAGLITTR